MRVKNTAMSACLNDEILPIPHTNGLMLSRGGEISGRLNIKSSIRDNLLKVHLPVILSDGEEVILGNLKLATLISVVFKGSRIPAELWGDIDTYIVGDGLLADNIIHQIYPKHFIYEFEGIKYKIIPNFTRYGISECGEVYDSEFGVLHKGHRRRQDGYVEFKLWSDIRKKFVRVLRHRALALCYHTYPESVDWLDVNHKNSIKGDDELDNIEWSTRKDNILHGIYSNEAYTTTIYDLKTKSFTHHRTDVECAKIIGVSSAYIGRLLSTKSLQIINGRYRVTHYSTDSLYDEEHPLATTPPTIRDYINGGLVRVTDGDGDVVWSGSGLHHLNELFSLGYANSAYVGTKYKRSRGRIIPNHDISISIFSHPTWYGCNIFSRSSL